MEKSKVYADVGGTSTRVWITFPDNKAPQHFLFPTHLHFLKDQIKESIQKTSVRNIELLVGIRGVWKAEEKKLWEKTLNGLGSKVTVMSDVELTHVLAFGNSPGILLNAGTGSIAFGKSPRGQIARAGGLGPLLGDEGSGFWIGKEYLKKVFKKDRNLDKIRSYAVDPQAIPKIASLSQLILKRKNSTKDPFIAPIIEGAYNHLQDLIAEIIEQLKWKGPIPVKLSGGLFENSGFQKGFIKKLKKQKAFRNILFSS